MNKARKPQQKKKSPNRQERSSSYKPVRKVDVYVWGMFAGAVALDPKIGFYVFAWDKTFARKGYELSPLCMPLNDSEEVFVFSGLPEATYHRLPPMLADALPDDFGNALIDRYMAAKGIQTSSITALDRLAYMGTRGIGALEFKPARGPRSKKSSAIEMGKLVNLAREVVRGTLDTDSHSEAALRSIIEVGTSANGARAKAVVSWNRKTNEIRSGQVNSSDGFEQWLLKFDGMGPDLELGNSQDYGRTEYAYYLMARDAGINISDSILFEENGRAHFMTKRFDREDGNIKHHMQSLCAMNKIDFKKKSTNSYEQLFMTIRELKLPRSDELEAFRRMTFNVMARNCDDHSKNFSFLLRKHQSWILAPAYDVTFAHNPNGQWTSQHLMSVNEKYRDIQFEDFLAIANRFGIGEVHRITSEVYEAIKKWSNFAKVAGVPEEERNRIKKYLRPIMQS